VAPDWPACERFEPPLAAASCGTCGACCREGFHLAPVGRREALAKRHSELLVRDDLGLHLPRPGGHCVALAGAGEAASPWRCRVYADRPRACSDLAVASASCLLARRRVGLSR
jgi:Fe-S-cluster containining protein